MTSYVLTGGNDTLETDKNLYGIVNGSPNQIDLLNASVNAGAGFDTFRWYDSYPSTYFKITTPAAGGILLVATMSAASGGGSSSATLALKNFEKLQFDNVSISLAPTVGVDLLNGTALADTFHALEGNDRLLGNAGNDLLDGGAGTDTMIGGTGNDTFVIDTLSDVTTELVGGGADQVNVDIGTVSGTYKLGANLENATLINTVNFNLTGNALANTLTGNAESNVLNGGTGIDKLIGGGGNDAYVIDTLTDKITELAGGGTDTVKVGVTTAGGTYTLAANLEKALLTSTVAFNLTGNGLDNLLKGNAAANVLKGGAGDDLLIGGLGADHLTGGSGADSFRFDSPPSKTNIDTLTDFTHGTDHLLLDDAIFKALAEVGTSLGTTLGAGEFCAGTVAAEADDRFVYDSATGKLFYDKNGNVNGATDQIQLAVLGTSSHPTLDASDFLIV